MQFSKGIQKVNRKVLFLAMDKKPLLSNAWELARKDHAENPEAAQ